MNLLIKVNYQNLFFKEVVDIGKDNDLYNMLLPMSSAMFKRVFPKEVRGTFFHVTDVDGFENLYDIQNSKKSIFAFANMSPDIMRTGIASGSGVVAELEVKCTCKVLLLKIYCHYQQEMVED